ncbi:Dihydrolipoyllysine-residue acetyltransferase component of pyruvate dehydrogenase complex [Spiroplasma poulsonii]|nr:Dihydrolipoyllysine-residue acetyltransferase component of pyruvate dehydrogenase complex [Spiroplasma poulsonii]
MKEGTFTITNFGSAGIELATPVINFPEVAILGVGIIKKTPVINSNNEVEVSSILPLSLTIDHRLIDGADGGRFLARVTELLESPALLLL